MTTKELYEKRIMPALNQMFKEANHIFPFEEKLTYEDIISHCNKNDRGEYEFPFDAFYLSSDRQDAISKEARKGFKHHWRFPYRTEYIFSDKEIERMKKDLEKMDPDSFDYKITKEHIDDNEKNKKKNAIGDAYIKETHELYDKRNKKEITTKEFNKAFDEIAKKYNCYKYSSDANVVAFELAFCSPTTNKSYMEEVKKWFNLVLENEETEITAEPEYRTPHVKDSVAYAVSFYKNYISGKTNGWQSL